jgi:NosR/NirI family transcriptional regulator, nitrous oxide reductase regulator
MTPMNFARRSKTSPPLPADEWRRGKRWLIAGYRLGLLVAAFFCLHAATARREAGNSNALDPQRILPVLKSFLPKAATIGTPDPDDRLCPVMDRNGEILGWAAQTSPESLTITGYSGASNLLVVFDASRRVIGTTLLDSADTVGHVEKVTDTPEFFQQWNGRSQSSLSQPGKPAIITGASLTSEAMARGLAARFGAAGMDRWFPAETDISDVRVWFPEAAELKGTRVFGKDGRLLGSVLRASRMDVAVRGFQGASDVLVALDSSEKTIVGVAMPGSRDNEPYTSDVRDGLRFEKPFAGMPVADAMDLEPGSTLMVSGASRTAEAVEETVKEMLVRHLAAPIEDKPWLGLRDWAAFVWIAAGMWIGFGPQRGNRKLRALFAVISVVGGGWWLGLMTGQDQWIKSSMRGSLSGTALPLLALTAAALLVPAVSGKNIYCARLCPHGAAQEWMGRLRKRRFALPPRWHRFFGSVPWLTLGLLWLLAFLGIGFPFANAEPFEVWSAGFFALMPVLIFLIGLAGAVFLPQAYCHYGCPTGAVLKFLSSSPVRLTRRDAVIGAVVALAWLSLLIP